MMNPFSKMPFLFLLIPLIGGIILQYHLHTSYLSIAFSSVGIVTMLLSYLLCEKQQYRFRWLFGFGVCLFVTAIAIESTSIHQQKAKFAFTDKDRTYKGIVTDSPQEKPKTTVYRTYLPDYDKQIICYVQYDSINKPKLQPGTEFLFYGKIQPFRNMGNPDDFDYVRYMYNQGFAGSAYILKQNWRKTGETSSSPIYIALQCRQNILDFYEKLGFTETEYAILSALTLGYKDALTDDLKEGFRTAGVVHVLSVSGLHAGIFFLMINFLLGFIKRSSKYYWIKPTLCIIILWIYAFVTGLPISIVRAGIMLTILCISQIAGKQKYALHSLFIAAFFILLISPFSLFDIGFQLSFMSVLAILHLQPKVVALLKTGNKFLSFIWQMFTVSLVAQLATAPICLYYFGTFPTYFFIANLLIVPLVSFIIYTSGTIVIAKLLSMLFPDLSLYFYYLPVKILQILVNCMTSVIKVIEHLPYANISDQRINFTELVLVFTIIISLIIFFSYKRVKALSIGLLATLIFISLQIYENTKEKEDTFIVYNRRQATEIRWNVGNTADKIELARVGKYPYRILKINNQNILILSTNEWMNKETNRKFDISNLVLTTNNDYSLYSLTQIITPKRIILDGSLSVYTRKRLSKECQKLNIPYHDVVEDGAFSLIF